MYKINSYFIYFEYTFMLENERNVFSVFLSYIECDYLYYVFKLFFFENKKY